MKKSSITHAILKRLAGAATYQRGEAYFSAGAVTRLRVGDDKITARVEGTESYRVELRDDDGELTERCTCPHAAEGNFCKHCVAVGLAWLAEQASAGKPKANAGKTKRHDPWQAIKDYLTAQPPETLIGLLLDVAQRDDPLYRSLLLNAERSGGSGKGDALKAYRRAIDGATQFDGFIDWRAVGDVAGDIDQVVDSLAELLRPETAALLVELAEYAIEKLEKALEHVDDSNGEVGGIGARLGELHYKACVMANPDPAGLAERLFRLEKILPFGLCSFDANTYRKPLGKTGLRRYRELAEAEWHTLKPLGKQDRFDPQRWRITRIMEQLAEASGDIEELVKIKSHDLSSGYQYLSIAEIWAKAKQPEKALEWAERGLKAFPDHPDNRLRDFLVSIYLKRKRNDEALQLTWVQFDEHPYLETYKKLHHVATKLGLWAAQRERALAKLAADIALKASATSKWRPTPAPLDHSRRVEIALWENDLEAAWMAAHQGTCDRSLLVALAGKLEASRPKDAISLYQRVVPPIIEQTNNPAYEEAARLIRKVGKLMQAQHQGSRFRDYLTELRAQFKPKRNFIRLLDGVMASAMV